MQVANRVIKNTGILYAKMGITMFISLYTTRLILNSLGSSDFGIFNVVGGVIAMLGFFNAAMAGATQRFMSYYNNSNKMQLVNIFNISFILHFLIAFIIGIILFCSSYIFFNGILNIPPTRIHSAYIVYYLMIFDTMFNIISAPSEAVINAHENMLFYSIIGIIESFLKLTIAFIVVYTSFDKLIVYSAFMASTSFIILITKYIYIHWKYSECILAPTKYWNMRLMKEMITFTGWNFIKTTSSIITMQGTSIILNSYFGVIANTAHGISNQLSGQLMSFSNNMLKALNPVITKLEGVNNRNGMVEAALTGNKLSFLLLSFFSIPFILEMPSILNLWLKETPEYAIIFCRLILIRLSITQLSITFVTAIDAIGNIRLPSIYNSIITLSTIPSSLILYNCKAPIYTIYLLLIIMVIFTLILNLHFMKRLCNISINNYLYDVVFKCIIVSGITILIGTSFSKLFHNSSTRLLFVCFSCSVTFLFLFYIIGLNKKEKTLSKNLLKKILSAYAA